MKQTGQILREQREKLGLTIQEVSLSLKINARTIKAMEEGEVTQLPPRTFLRGFVHSYATHLKLDAQHVMSVFHEELGISHQEHNPTSVNSSGVETSDSQDAKTAGGSTSADILAEPAIEKAPVLSPNTPLRSGQTSKLTTIALVLLAVGILIVIVVVKKTIDKYQRESRVFAPPTNVQAIHPSGDKNKSAHLKSHSSHHKTTVEETIKTAAPGEEIPAMRDENKKTNKSKSAPATTSANTKSTNVAKPASDESTIAKPSATQVKAQKTPKGASTDVQADTAAKSSATPPANTPAAPATGAQTKTQISTRQEIIIQALAPVKLSVRINGGSVQVMKLKANEVRAIKGSKIKIHLSDGGAVNLIHNGQDAGVPGNLGEPLDLNFPSKK